MKKLFFILLLFQFASIDLLMALNVADDMFVCVDVTTDSILNSLHSQKSSNTLELPLNGVIPGNYILRMTSKDGMILSTSQLVINQF